LLILDKLLQHSVLSHQAFLKALETLAAVAVRGILSAPPAAAAQNFSVQKQAREHP
jgi:hypothetical protein